MEADVRSAEIKKQIFLESLVEKVQAKNIFQRVFSGSTPQEAMQKCYGGSFNSPFILPFPEMILALSKIPSDKIPIMYIEPPKRGFYVSSSNFQTVQAEGEYFSFLIHPQYNSYLNLFTGNEEKDIELFEQNAKNDIHNLYHMFKGNANYINKLLALSHLPTNNALKELAIQTLFAHPIVYEAFIDYFKLFTHPTITLDQNENMKYFGTDVSGKIHLLDKEQKGEFHVISWEIGERNLNGYFGMNNVFSA